MQGGGWYSHSAHSWYWPKVIDHLRSSHQRGHETFVRISGTDDDQCKHTDTQLLKKHPSPFIFLPHTSTSRFQLRNISFTNQMQSFTSTPPHNPTLLPANLFSLHCKLLNEVVLRYHCKLSFLGLKHPNKSRASPINASAAQHLPGHCTAQDKT